MRAVLDVGLTHRRIAHPGFIAVLRHEMKRCPLGAGNGCLTFGFRSISSGSRCSTQLAVSRVLEYELNLASQRTSQGSSGGNCANAGQCCLSDWRRNANAPVRSESCRSASLSIPDTQRLAGIIKQTQSSWSDWRSTSRFCLGKSTSERRWADNA